MGRIRKFIDPFMTANDSLCYCVKICLHYPVYRISKVENRYHTLDNVCVFIQSIYLFEDYILILYTY